jgi:putative Mg2+ transporter-C (MgtC) family protein
MWIGQMPGQGWLQLGELGLAFVLSALIGLEREIRQKSAGLRTYTLLGFSAALIMLVSKYGFTNVLEFNRVVLDPSRIAAQIVTGIGFIGGGLIFVRRGSVRGLMTAAGLAHGGGWHGMRCWLADPRARGDRWSFHHCAGVSIHCIATA